MQLLAQPVITSFTPASGPVGSTVTINGSGFNPNPTGNIVYFGAKQAVVTAASSSILSVVVPTGATYKPITITTNSLTASSAFPFITTFPGGGLFVPSSFVAAGETATAPSPYRSAVSDLDGDGKTDLVVLSNDTFSISRNVGTNGAVAFAHRVNFSTTATSSALDVGDIDGDGKPDIAVAINDISSSAVRIYKNTSTPGTISFSFLMNVSTGVEPTSVLIRDLDGDGKPELITVNLYYKKLGIVSNTSSNGTVSFSTRQESDFGIYTGILDVAIGDLNGDRKPDLLLINQTSNLYLVQNISTGPGNVSFLLKGMVTGSYIKGPMTLGDLDGDGKLDLAAANVEPNNTISLWRNTSSGNLSFAPRADYTVGTLPIALSINDMDGDGKPDLVVANEVERTISLLRNTGTSGTISFANRVNYPVESTARDIAVGDFTEDGKPDLAVINSPSDKFTVLVNKVDAPRVLSFTPTSGGVGTTVTITGANFTGATTVSFGGTPATSFTVQSPTTMTAVVGEGSNGAVSVTTPLGDGWLDAFSFQGPVITSLSPATGPVGTTVTITGQNFSAVPANNVVYFGAVQAPVLTASPTTLTVSVPVGATYQPLTVTAFKLTGYALKPFIVTSTAPPVSFTAASFAPAQNFTTSASPYGATVGDLDGDGKSDVVMVDKYARLLIIFRNISTDTGLVAFAPKVEYSAGTEPMSVSMGDFNGDGKLDLAVNNKTAAGNGSCSIYINNSIPGKIDFSPGVDFGAGRQPRAVAVGDLNGDCKPDVAVVNEFGETVSFLKNNSTSTHLSFAPKVEYVTNGWPQAITLGDLNGDGKPDAAVVDNTSNTVSFYINKSTVDSLIFSDRQSYNVISSPSGVAIGDLDGDGKPDVAVTTQFGSDLYVFRNQSTNGVLSLANPIKYNMSVSPAGLLIGDMNGDGKVDLVTVNGGGWSVSVLQNASTIGSLAFLPRVDYAVIATPNSIAMGDFDRDGRPDLCTSNSGFGYFSVLRNTGLGTVLITAVRPVVGTNIGMQLYPNPTESLLTIDHLLLADKWETLEIRSADGKQLFETETLKWKTMVTINVSHLAAGLYIASLHKKSGAPVFLKFVKQ